MDPDSLNPTFPHSNPNSGSEPDGDHPTLALGSGGSRPRAAGTPEFPSGTRFQEVAFLGQGGMGQVFSASDPTLGRRVAIKLLRTVDREQRARFFLEARALAQVDHPNVIPIFEVGEVSGQPYFLMPLLEGLDLVQATENLDIATRVSLIRQISLGLHAAHLQGVLHRDIKPSNILVVREESGNLHPYLLDFGLARIQDAPNLTVDGQFMGTPSYISPEQALGPRKALDVRSDLFSLGVSFYEVLSRVLPFQGDSTMEVVLKVIDAEPEPLRTLVPDLPEDLEVIVHTCMQKDPDQRYGSARELAEDLQRFLEERPIRARPPSLAYRTRMWGRRHRRLALAGSALALILGASAFWGVSTVIQVRTHAARVERCLQEAHHLETEIRLARMAPLHDTRKDVQGVEEMLKTLVQGKAGLGPREAAPFEYALGRTHWNLGRSVEAREELEKAWRGGFRVPEAALALGSLLADQYADGLGAAQGIRDKDAKEAEIARLKRTLRDPAMSYLQQARTVAGERQVVGARLAYLEGRFEEASRLARSVAEGAPGNHTAFQMWSMAEVSLAGDAEQANDLTAARRHWDTAEEAMGMATEVARSSARTHYLLALQRMRRAAFETYQKGDQELWHTRAGQSLEVALKADPGFAPAYALRSELFCRRALKAYQTGGADEAGLDAAIRDGETASLLDPSDISGPIFLGKALLTRAERQLDRGLDPGAVLGRGADLLDRATLSHPESADALLILCYARYLQGKAQLQEGKDPRPYYEKGLEAAQRVCSLDRAPTHRWGAVLSMANTLMDEEWLLGDGTSRALAAADKALGMARPALGTDPNFCTDEARHLRHLALKAHAEGRDPSAEIRLALASLDKALSLDPKFREAFQEQSTLNLLKARWSLGSPVTALAEAWTTARTAMRLSPGVLEPILALGEAARFSCVLTPKDSLQRVKEARAALKACLARTPNAHRARALLGALEIEASKHEFGSEKEGEALMEAALKVEPLLARTYR